jgi:phosphatidylserine synthase
MKRLMPKPMWIENIEKNVAQKVPIHPNAISLAKLFLVTPLLFLALRQVNVLPHSAFLVGSLFLVFAALDYLDGVVARAKKNTTYFGNILDRLTDYPLLIIVSWYCLSEISPILLVSKVVIDTVLLILFMLGKGSTENRLRTGISYITLFALLFLSQGWSPRFLSHDFVENLLVINILFSIFVALHNLGLVGKFLIADLLSGANLLCGIFSMYHASQGRYEISLLLLMIGAGFDGLDGAAARRWGGTKWGVYSDDIADGVNYGLAPGVALYYAINGYEGLVVGAFYSVFTISRLVFFTLNKEGSDPNFFAGVPSTVGGLIALSAICIFPENQALLGLLVGFACVLMISFDTNYRHLGRAAGEKKKQIIWGMPVLILVTVLGTKIWGLDSAIGLVLLAALGYGLQPVVNAFKRVMADKIK